MSSSIPLDGNIKVSSEKTFSRTAPGHESASSEVLKSSSALSTSIHELDDRSPPLSKLDAPNGSADTDLGRLTGLKLHGLTLTLCIALLLATLEVTIIGTSLVPITNDLGSFERSSWVVTSYLLGYAGFVIIWAKISDIFGRRRCMALSILVLMVFSGACGAAQTTTQLIILRALQGVGGSGVNALTFVIIPEMVEAEKYSRYAAILAVTFALSYLMGPLLGGAICNKTTWRWIFLINVPAGAVVLVLLYIFMPSGFPFTAERTSSTQPLSKKIFRKVDFLGTTLLFGTSAFLVAAFEEASSLYPWSSAIVIALLVLSALFCVLFVGWQYYLGHQAKAQEAVFPWRLMKQRVFMASLAIGFCTGVPFTVAVIQIPQRYQTVGDTSALSAGVKLLPYTLCTSVGIISANLLGSRLRVPCVFVLLLGATMQIISTALMTDLPVEPGPRNYGFETLLALGLGMNLGMLVQMTPQIILGEDQAVAMGAVTQFRSLGGVIGLAISTNALNGYVKPRLSSILSAKQLSGLLQYVGIIETFPTDLQGVVRATFGKGYDLQMKIMIGFGVAQVLLLPLMWEKQLRRVA